jgi:hypothetical protein
VKINPNVYVRQDVAVLSEANLCLRKRSTLPGEPLNYSAAFDNPIASTIIDVLYLYNLTILNAIDCIVTIFCVFYQTS